MKVIEYLHKEKYEYDYGLSNSDVNFAINKIEKQKFFYDNHFLTLPDGREALLSQVVSNFYVNPNRYISEIKHRIYELYDVAKLKDLVPVFLTITLPSEYHRHKYIEVSFGKEVKVKNKNFNSDYEEYTPRNLVEILQSYFKSFVDLRAVRNIPKDKRLYFKVIEPHKTGVPHMHIMYFIPKENISKFKNAFVNFCERKNILQYDFQVNIYNPINYLIKYILKSVDDYRFENTENFKFSNLVLWYVRWGIRRFSMSRVFCRLDLYRKFNGRYSLSELTGLVKDGYINYLSDVNNQITHIFFNDDLLGEIPYWIKKDQGFIEYKEVIRPRFKEKFTNVYNENRVLIGMTNGKQYISFENAQKSLSEMTKSELFEYERDLLNEFDNPFNDEVDLDILIDKFIIFNRYVDEDYNYRKVPEFWLREEDLNLRPSGYEPDELPDCSIPRQKVAGLGGFEPPNDGVKVRCLTAWRQPNIVWIEIIIKKFLKCKSFKNFHCIFL